MKSLQMVSFILLVVGGLNWLLIGLFDGYDLVAVLLGSGSVLAKIVYVLVGLSAIFEIVTHKRNCKCCESAPASM